MTDPKPSRDRADLSAVTAAGVRRLSDAINALAPLQGPPPHDPDPGTVGEFAYAWFTQGANRALADFAPVAAHLGIAADEPAVTPFVLDQVRPVMPDRFAGLDFLPDARVLARRSAVPLLNLSTAWGASLGVVRESPPRSLPMPLRDTVSRARHACRECAAIMGDTFEMALDEGDPMHRSHREVPTRPPSPRDLDEVAAAMPTGWGVPAQAMPDFALAMAPPQMDAGDEDVALETLTSFARTYEIGASRLALVPGDLSRSTADVLVSSDDDALAMGGGVSRALLEASGHLLRHEADRAIGGGRPIVGDVVVTAAPGLPSRFIFHAVTLRNVHGRRQPVLIDGSVGAVVRLCIHRVFDLAEALGVRSIALPVLGAGAAKVPYGAAMHEMADAIFSRLLGAATPIDVEVYLHDRYGRRDDAELVEDFAAHVGRRREFELVASGTTVHVRPWLDETTDTSTRPRSSSRPAPLSGADPVPEPRRRQALVRALAQLDARRSEIERAHVHAIIGKERSSPGALASLGRILATLRARRGAIEDLITSAPGPSDPRTIFVSSTLDDLRAHRDAIRAAISAAGLEFVGAENVLTTREIPRDATLPHLARAGTYVAVVGWRYGSTDEASGYSFTELEYLHALGQRKEVRAFVMDDSVPVRASERDPEPERYERLMTFRDTLRRRHGVTTFTDPADLATKVRRALPRRPA